MWFPNKKNESIYSEIRKPYETISYVSYDIYFENFQLLQPWAID